VKRNSKPTWTECLQVCSDTHVAFVFAAGGQHFTEIDRPSLGSNGPHHVSHILRPEAIRRRQSFEVKINDGAAAAGFYFRPAVRLWQKAGSLEADLRGGTAVEVVDRGNIARDYFNFVERFSSIELDRCLPVGRLLPLGRVRLLCA